MPIKQYETTMKLYKMNKYLSIITSILKTIVKIKINVNKK